MTVSMIVAYDSGTSEAQPLQGLDGLDAVRLAAVAARVAGQRCRLAAVGELATLTEAAVREPKKDPFPLQQAWQRVMAIVVAADRQLARGDGFPDGAAALCRKEAAEAALSVHRAAFRLSRSDRVGAAQDAEAAWHHADEAVELQAAIYFGAREYRRWRLLRGRRGSRGPAGAAHLRLLGQLLQLRSLLVPGDAA